MWFATLTGPVDREALAFGIQVAESVTFRHSPVRMRATLVIGESLDTVARVTTGYRAAGDRWQIVHQPTSLPSTTHTPKDPARTKTSSELPRGATPGAVVRRPPSSAAATTTHVGVCHHRARHPVSRAVVPAFTAPRTG
ncbi:hypothetical protein ACFZBZ_34390 [Streptomyces sp. NPDC008196]|uniref:hypothetical protein n=1 Tax=Streptomyces sp. NPDC008196 TaxID=3364819 RepID=UPI0036EE03DD